MRRKQRYTVHRRQLLTFLLLGCVGSFILGQEMARAFAAIPVYAAQSLTFSGAGITASLITPIQVSGAIGQPTPQPKVVKHPSKPATKSKGKGLSSKPAAPQQTPVNTPPIALPGTTIQVSPSASPCASASCLPSVNPAPPVVPPPVVLPLAAVPTGITHTDAGSSTSSLDGSSTASSSGAPSLQCAPPGLVSRPASPAQRETQARCASTKPDNDASFAKKPQPASPGVIETPVTIEAPQGTLPTSVVSPAIPAPATNLDQAPAIDPAATAPLPAAGDTTPPSSATPAAGSDDQNPLTIPATSATDQPPEG
jgi:hypothetical protein